MVLFKSPTNVPPAAASLHLCSMPDVIVEVFFKVWACQTNNLLFYDLSLCHLTNYKSIRSGSSVSADLFKITHKYHIGLCLLVYKSIIQIITVPVYMHEIV